MRSYPRSEMPQTTASVAEKEEERIWSKQSKIEVQLFHGFFDDPDSRWGSKVVGRKKRRRERKVGALLKLWWPLRPLIFDEHEKRMLRLPQRKKRNRAQRSSMEDLKEGMEDFIEELFYLKPDSMGPISPRSEGKKTPIRSLPPPPIRLYFGLSRFCQAQGPYGLSRDILSSLK